jgi:hypothetical protein
MNLGRKFEKAVDGANTFAAKFVVKVASISANIDKIRSQTFPNRERSWTGSQIASPKTTTVALVTATPIKA